MTKFIVFSLVLHVIFIVSFGAEKAKVIEEKKEVIAIEFFENNIKEDISTPILEKKIENTKNMEKTSALVKENNLEKEIKTEEFEPIIEEKRELTKEISNTEKVVVVEKSEEAIKEVKAEIVSQVTVKSNEESKKTVSELAPISSNTNNDINISQERSSPPVQNQNIIQSSQTGNYIAENQNVKGLEYKILYSPEPEYPLMAKKAGYLKSVVIKVRILVDEEGRVTDIRFYDENKKFGFHQEVEKTLKKWKFTPIKLNDKPVKMYFYKNILFNVK